MKRTKIFHVTSHLLAVLVFFCIASSNLQAQLDEALKAHGGVEAFRQFGTLQYDLKGFPFGPKAPLNDRQLFDLYSRRALITSETYRIGFDGHQVWINDPDALAIPARFYAFTPFYFFGLPFFFADPGCKHESLGTKTLDGNEYEVVKFFFEAGIGDTPDDNYVAYFDKETHLLKLVHYIVTYPAFSRGKSPEELERHAIVYDEWQEVDGLLVPKEVSSHGWKEGKLVGESSPSWSYENVSFKKEQPAPGLFAKAEGAAVDESHKTMVSK